MPADDERSHALIKTLSLGGAAICLTAALSVTVGGGVASSDDVVGRKYSEMKAALSARRISTQIASTIGGRRAQDDCIVTSAHAGSTVDGFGNSRPGTMLVNLDCGGK
ncbi:hypothetical protein [Mycobacterium sp. NPDC006124]|uniref:hypothetical protein n=1 Tax=Mycobacterium sp. NPDC006124 TaxID=3156729 RepID=UPI0033A18D66